MWCLERSGEYVLWHESGGSKSISASGHCGTAVTLKRGGSEPFPKRICGWNKVWSPSLLLWSLWGGSKAPESLEKWILGTTVMLICTKMVRKEEESLKKKSKMKSGVKVLWFIQDELWQWRKEFLLKQVLRSLGEGGAELVLPLGFATCFWQQLHLFEGNYRIMELIRLEKTFKSNHHHHVQH